MNDQVSLSTIGGGAAVERFDDELRRVLDNIIDPNTPPKAMRKVTLEVKIKPDVDREIGQVEIVVKSQIAPAEAYETKFIIGKDMGRGVATEYISPKQRTLQESIEDKKVLQMKGIE